jgi:MFS family permease
MRDRGRCSGREMIVDNSPPSSTDTIDLAVGEASTAAEWLAGWPAVAGAMLGMGAGQYMFNTVIGFFVKPLGGEFGWSRGHIAASSGALFVASLCLPVSGILTDRYGIRPLLAIGTIIFAICYVALSCMTGSLWQYFVIMGIVGVVAGPCTSPFIFTVPIINAFRKARGQALALIMCGVPLLSIVVFPVLQHLITTSGWRSGYLFLGTNSILLGAAAFVLLGKTVHRPEGNRDHPREGESLSSYEDSSSFRRAMRDPRFTLLIVAALAISLAVGGVINAMQPMLSDRGVKGQTAALLGVWQVITLFSGRLISGFLLDRVWPPLVGCVMLGLPSVGLLILLYSGSEVLPLAVGIACVGAATGAETDIVSFFAARYFGLKSFGSVISVIGGVCGASLALGGVFSGYVFDWFRNYDLMLLGGAACSLIASGAIFLPEWIGRTSSRVEGTP